MLSSSHDNARVFRFQYALNLIIYKLRILYEKKNQQPHILISTINAKPVQVAKISILRLLITNGPWIVSFCIHHWT